MAYLANVLLFIAFNNNRIVCSLYMCFNVLLIFLEKSIQLIGIELPISDGVYSRSSGGGTLFKLGGLNHAYYNL